LKRKLLATLRLSLGLSLSLSLFLSLSLPLAGCAAPSDAGPAQPATTSQVPGSEWEHVDPAQAGWSVDGLADAKRYANTIGSTSVMIVQHGRVIDEWGDTKVRTPLYSVRKSFMSALIGIAVDRKQIRLDQTLEQLGIDDNAPSLTQEEKQATVQQLLEARSGVYHPTVYETRWMKSIKPERGSHAPGTFWVYNNWDFNALGGIYEKATGTSIFQAVQDEIATPIGMQDYRQSDGQYVSGEPGSRYPAYPMTMSARDLARFAVLFLNDGRWNGKQIVPASWVAESTRPYSDSPYGGYGYMWWTSDSASGVRGPDATIIRRAYWADGHLGQYAIVVPSLDLVVVTRVDPKQTSKQVGEQKKAKLLWFVETAMHAPDIGPEPVIH
jgi:CubicO group peptidase (beta-lactamase class C family)